MLKVKRKKRGKKKEAQEKGTFGSRNLPTIIEYTTLGIIQSRQQYFPEEKK